MIIKLCLILKLYYVKKEKTSALWIINIYHLGQEDFHNQYLLYPQNHRS